MTKARVTKLLAVVAMTTGAAGAAFADPAKPAVTARPIAAAVTPPIVAAAESALVAVRLLQSLSIELAKPRTMASGAPACGNVASRAPRPASCEPRTTTPSEKP